MDDFTAVSSILEVPSASSPVQFEYLKNSSIHQLPILRWPYPKARKPLVIVIVLDESRREESQEERLSASKFLRAILDEFCRLPGFNGMAYKMRNANFPEIGKIGQTNGNAFVRLARSPWAKEFGRTSHADRRVDMVLVCLDITAKVVETTLHKAFSKQQVSLGWGREWFKLDFNSFYEKILEWTEKLDVQIWLEPQKPFLPEYFTSADNGHALITAIKRDNPIGTFFGLGKPKYLSKLSGKYTVVSDVWLQVRFRFPKGDLPQPYFELPFGLDVGGDSYLINELGKVEPNEFDMIPDLMHVGRRLECRDPKQKLHQVEFIGNIGDYEIDPTNDEWEVAGKIYRVTFSSLVRISESFQRDRNGKWERSGSKIDTLY
ncbi:GIY-YIG nuclease family protein [Gemmobacter lanyuensis]|nr:GIY-YIG nuclease family protein [Gemmobacter lanyuensis]